MPRKGTVDPVFVLRKPTEKFRGKNKKLFFMFFDLEKVFDWMPREVIRFALRQKVIRFALRRKDDPEYLVDGLCIFIKTVKLQPQLMENCQVYFL